MLPRRRIVTFPVAAPTRAVPRVLCSNCHSDDVLPPSVDAVGGFIVCADCGHTSRLERDRLGQPIGDSSRLAA